MRRRRVVFPVLLGALIFALGPDRGGRRRHVRLQPADRRVQEERLQGSARTGPEGGRCEHPPPVRAHSWRGDQAALGAGARGPAAAARGARRRGLRGTGLHPPEVRDAGRSLLHPAVRARVSGDRQRQRPDRLESRTGCSKVAVLDTGTQNDASRPEGQRVAQLEREEATTARTTTRTATSTTTTASTS